jgi:hypothetical protein
LIIGIIPDCCVFLQDIFKAFEEETDAFFDSLMNSRRAWTAMAGLVLGCGLLTVQKYLKH